mmetsp:Transcript_37424/g.120041  ORF Transcript_37424/g.120041 Transcript_37424/m.120041 type:complete len:409 (-) Transcript_37424:1256-2482(-)
MGFVAAVASLVKTIIGGGMLALPAGMAAGRGTGVVPATLIVVAHALLSAYTYVLVGRSVAATNARDFRELWALSLSPKTAFAVDAMVAGVAFGAILTYGCFLGDLLATLCGVSRSTAIVGVTFFPLLPLALARDLSALKASSMGGILAVLFSAFVVVKRALDGSYTTSGGEFFSSSSSGAASASSSGSSSPTTELSSWWHVSAGTCVLFNMLSTAYMAHTNAVRAYRELKDKSQAGQVAVTSFGVTAILYAAVMLAGFKTFGKRADGLILSNFHPKDALGLATKAATTLSIVASHPLIFTSLRDSATSLAKNVVKKMDDDNHVTISLALLLVCSGLSLVIKDAGFVVSINGASVGAALIFLPCAIFLNVGARSPNERTLLKSLIVLGALLAAFGTAITCLNTFTDLLD